MNGQALRTHDEIAAIYLQQLQELAFEISVATDAIAANALPEFQESVAKQEMLCSTLAMMTNSVRDGYSPPNSSLLAPTDNVVELKIRATGKAIAELNLQYAALLRHSGKSIGLLISLCRNHTGNYQEALGPRSKHQTWSCEM